MSTSRLKRKAEYEPDLLQGNNLNESFVTYGTPLPSLGSTKKDQGEYVPLWKQEVRDERGRRRLHGAFTGGFSAGYFNTVGSKEGWAPSTFVSKKDREQGISGGSSRDAGSSARPEDFMDEEDLAELNAARTFKTAEGFSGPAASTSSAAGGLGFAGEKDADYTSAVANSLKDLVKPSTSRIGQQMMIRMGWKPGQGVGPRITYDQRKAILQELKLARSGTGAAGSEARQDPSKAEDEDEEDDDSEEARKHLYAPIDRPLVLYDNKENQWGLGYVPRDNLVTTLASAAAISTSRGTQRRPGLDDEGPMIEGSRMPTLASAYGISALEDEDEDDVDVYGGSGSLSGTGHVGNMYIDDGEDDGEAGFGGKRRPELMKWQNPRGKSKRTGPSASDAARATPMERYADGTPVLPGFKLASKMQQPDKWYPPTAIPKGWEPNPRKIWEAAKSKREAEQKENQPTNLARPQQKGRQNTLNADDRARMLGEPVLPKSVFDYMTAKIKERIDDFVKTAGSSQDASLRRQEKVEEATFTPGPRRQEEVSVVMPSIDTRIAQSALKGFMPYGDDMAKQTRYKAFLTHHASPHDPSSPHHRYNPQPLPGKTIADLNKELQDFANAALIFKPMSSMIANRFTSSSAPSTLLDIKAPEAGLHRPTPKPAPSASDTEDAEQRARDEKAKEEKDPRRLAVKRGDYGPLTRNVEPWYPARLLCKRFNVAYPHPNGPASQDAASDAYTSTPIYTHSSNTANANKNVLNNDTMDALMSQRDPTAYSETVSMPATGTQDNGAGARGSSVPAGPSDITIPSLANVGLGEDESQGRDTLTYQKPDMSIFKAIFADSEDEDEDEDERNDEGAAGGSTPGHSKPTVAAAVQSGSVPEVPSNGHEVAASAVAATVVTAEEAVPLTMDSIATFKPTFKTKAERAESGLSGKDKDKNSKKKKKSSQVIVSFEMEDGDGEASSGAGTPAASSKADKKRKSESSTKSDGEKKKKHKKEKAKGDKKRDSSHTQTEADDEDEWVEKPNTMPTNPDPPATTASAPPNRSTRVRASELF